MDAHVIKSHIQRRQFNNFYIFTGPELTVANIYIHQIAKVFDADVVVLDDVSALIKRLHNTSLLAKTRHIYVLRDCKDFLSSDELQAKFERFNALETIVILVYTSIDKRSKLYKNFQDKIVQFDYMSEAVLVKYIQKEINLSVRNCEILIAICERDYGRILLEIDKIKQYEGETRFSNPDTTFEFLLESGTIYINPQDRIFDFVDAVLTYKPKLAFDLYYENIEFGTNALALISVLYNNTKQLLQYQSYTGDNIEAATGLNAFQRKLAQSRKGCYANDELIFLMSVLRKCEQGIKQGTIDSAMAIPYVLVSLWV